MDKELKRMVLVVGAISLVIGMIVLFSATNFGLAMAQNAINANGGSMDTEMYYWIMQSNARSFQMGGAIVSALGGLVTILGLYKMNEK